MSIRNVFICCFLLFWAVSHARTYESPFAILDLGPAKILSGDSSVRKLERERLEVALTIWRFAQENPQAHFCREPEYAALVLAARLALADTPDEQLAVHKQNVLFTRDLERRSRAKFDTNEIKEQYWRRARCARIEAEIAVVKAGALPPGGVTAVESAQPLVAVPPELANGLVPFFEAAPRAIGRDEPPLVRLQKDRCNCADREARLHYLEFLGGRGSEIDMWWAVLRAQDARLAFADNAEERLTIRYQFRDSSVAQMQWLRHLCLTDTAREWLHYAYLDATAAAVRESTTTKRWGPVDAPNQQAPPDKFDDPQARKPAVFRTSIYAVDEALPIAQWLPQKRTNAAISLARTRYHEFRVGRGLLSYMFDAAHRARDDRLELATDNNHRREILMQHRELMENMEDLNQKRFDAGAIRRLDLELTKYERLSAVIDLAKN